MESALIRKNLPSSLLLQVSLHPGTPSVMFVIAKRPCKTLSLCPQTSQPPEQELNKFLSYKYYSGYGSLS